MRAILIRDITLVEKGSRYEILKRAGRFESTRGEKVQEGTAIQVYGPFTGNVCQLVVKNKTYWCNASDLMNIITKRT